MNLRARASILVLLALASTASSAGYFYDGNDLRRLDEGTLRGYVAGIVDLRNSDEFCLPIGVMQSQATAVVKKYLDDNPQEWHRPAFVIVVGALNKSFPCRVGTTGLREPKGY